MTELIKEKWELDWQPAEYKPDWIVKGDPLPLLTVWFEDGDGNTIGFTGKHVCSDDIYRITYWTKDEPYKKWDADAEIERIIIENNKNPTTTNCSSSGIKSMRILGRNHENDLSESEIIYRVDVRIGVQYQRSYS